MTVPDLIRATLFHTVSDPSRDAGALVAIEDGGLLVANGRVAACGDFADVRRAHPEAAVLDWRGGVVLPGLVDTHIHYPQLRIIGRLGLTLLDWLEQAALPEEARMADLAYAADTARTFVRVLAAHGTTTASVFGAHFAPAVAALFEAAGELGLRVASGLIVSDRLLRPELHTTPEAAYRDSTELIARFHGRGRLLYSVTPRFALSASEAMLEVCQSLLTAHPGARFQTHLNEQVGEVAEVARLFPWASDYLGVYDRFQLTTRRSIFAHNVHATDVELERLAAAGSTVSHCPASNAALGSGIFPMARHLRAGVRCALGTDVGGGTGVGMLKEGLQAYLMQRVAPEPTVLSPAQLLFLSTRAGAEALGLADDIGDFGVGKAADFVYLRPTSGTVLAEALAAAGSLGQQLAAVFTLGDAEAVQEVRVEGAVVHRRLVA